MPIKGIAFDLEGTVINIESAHYYGHIAAAAEFGLIITLEEAYGKLEHFIGGPDEKVCEDIWKLLDRESQNQVSINDILARDKFHYERLLVGMAIEPRPGFIKFHRAAAKLGLELAIGSLTSVNQAMVIIERSGLKELFGDHIILRECVSSLKPAPDVFLKTAEIMDIDPRDQLVFEDSPRGVKAALAAGSKVIGMPVVIHGPVVAALVDSGVSRIFFHWGEINPRALVKNLDREGKNKR